MFESNYCWISSSSSLSELLPQVIYLKWFCYLILTALVNHSKIKTTKLRTKWNNNYKKMQEKNDDSKCNNIHEWRCSPYLSCVMYLTIFNLIWYNKWKQINEWKQVNSRELLVLSLVKYSYWWWLIGWVEK